jgi:protein-S-isoprenylcysteine O-methyltransferase Ste14
MAPATGDTIRNVIILIQRLGPFIYLPFGIVAAQHIVMALTYPNFPSWIARHVHKTSLDPRFFTWSRETAVPIALILGIGTPLRLISYGALGKNFTFTLAEPDQLRTSGLYRYIQHPSYTGVMALMLGTLGLWGRLGSAPSCFFPSWLVSSLRRHEKGVITLILAFAISVAWRRVAEEETMLGNKFGAEWEGWHARTARFIPFIF